MKATRAGPLPPLLLAIFFAVLYLMPLGAMDLWQPDETRYAEISREMLTSGDWITPRFLEVRYFEKPVAGYWVNNISQLLLGRSNFSARFGAAFSTGASALLVGCLAMLLWRERALAFSAALIYLSMTLVLGVGTYSLLDPMLGMWMSAAMLCLYPALRAQSGKRRLLCWALFGAACGMGALTKGLLAPALAFVAALPLALFERRIKEFLLYGPVAVLAAALVCLPWSLLIAAREPDYWPYFFWVEHIQRFAQSDAQHKSPFWFYLPVLAAACIPWLGLLPGSLKQGWSKRAAEPGLFYLLSWFLMPLLLLSLSKGKIVTYILPCMAPLALLMARYAHGLAEAPRALALKANAGINLALGLAACCALGLFLFNPPLAAGPLYAPGEEGKALTGFAALAVWCLLSLFCLFRPRGGGGANWRLAALCPLPVMLLLAQALPDSVADGKQPQRFIRQHEEALRASRHILSNVVGVAGALAWEMERGDILIFNSPGELKYGLFNYPEGRRRFVSGAEFPSWLERARQSGDVALLLRLQRRPELLDTLPEADETSREGRHYLLLYKQRGQARALPPPEARPLP